MTIKTEKTFVFIPGGWHGEWAFDAVIKTLKNNGRNAFALTLPGLEEQPQTGLINLDTHIQFVIDVLIKENSIDVILCGHSYAGLVITGVADKIPERICGLVYIDAYIPNDGDSCWSLTSETYRQLFVAGASNDGFTVAVPPGQENRRRPHPLATFMQSIRLTGDYQQVRNRTFIYLTGWDGSPFTKQYEALKNSSDLRIEKVHTGHNIMRENPDRLAAILNEME